MTTIRDIRSKDVNNVNSPVNMNDALKHSLNVPYFRDDGSSTITVLYDTTKRKLELFLKIRQDRNKFLSCQTRIVAIKHRSTKHYNIEHYLHSYMIGSPLGPKSALSNIWDMECGIDKSKEIHARIMSQKNTI